MKKTVALIGVLSSIAVFLVWSSSQRTYQHTDIYPTVILSPTQTVPPLVAITIDFGGSNKKAASVSATNAYEALTTIAAKEKLPVQTKQYDFGVFVESIRGLKSGSKKAWIYYVNGKSGQVAADKYGLKDGDKVEWKYTDVKNE